MQDVSQCSCRWCAPGPSGNSAATASLRMAITSLPGWFGVAAARSALLADAGWLARSWVGSLFGWLVRDGWVNLAGTPPVGAELPCPAPLSAVAQAIFYNELPPPYEGSLCIQVLLVGNSGPQTRADLPEAHQIDVWCEVVISLASPCPCLPGAGCRQGGAWDITMDTWGRGFPGWINSLGQSCLE